MTSKFNIYIYIYWDIDINIPSQTILQSRVVTVEYIHEIYRTTRAFFHPQVQRFYVHLMMHQTKLENGAGVSNYIKTHHQLSERLASVETQTRTVTANQMANIIWFFFRFLSSSSSLLCLISAHASKMGVEKPTSRTLVAAVWIWKSLFQSARRFQRANPNQLV